MLIYTEAEVADHIMAWSSRTCVDDVAWLLYEQINPEDAFGQIMLQNLRHRQIALPGIHACPTLAAQEERLHKHGFTTAHSMTLWDIWQTQVRHPVGLARVTPLEQLDETEEFQLLLSHYCFTRGLRARDDNVSSSWVNEEIRLS